MTLSIKIGAGSKIYDDISIAYAMRGYQKLSITGTGAELTTALTTLTAKADGISSIKSTSDIVLDAATINTNKAALLKLGTKSLVLQQSGGAETDVHVNTNFSSLDAIYTKFKSMNISGTPNIDMSKLSGVVNLVGMENLSGKVFTVTGTGTDLKTNINAIMKNISAISQINITGGTGADAIAELTADQLRIIGDKINKGVGQTVLLKDSASNLLTTNNLTLINKFNNTNLNPVSRTVTASATVATGGTAGTVVTSVAHGLNTGDAVTFAGTASGDFVVGTTFYVRKLTADTFSLYTDNATAINTSSYSGLKATATPASVNIAGTFTTQAGATPNRVTLLDDIQVTSASVAQAKQFDTLTTLNTSASPNRPLPNIISKVDIADTVANLTAGPAVSQTISAKVTATGTDAGFANNGLITIVGHGYSTGDAVTYNATTTADGGLTNNRTYYVGVIGNDSLALFTNKNAAMTATYTNQASVLASTNRVAFTGGAAGTETLAKLPTGADVTQTLGSAVIATGTDAGFANNGLFTLTGHGYKTGDAVTYSTAGTQIGGIVSGTTYYVGSMSANTFVLYASKNNAVAADLSTQAKAAASAGYKAMTGVAGSGDQKFTNSSLDSTMSAINRFKDGTGSVGRVTILGQGSISSTDLNRIATQANRGKGGATTYVAYSALGVDVNKNLQSLYDNKSAGTAIDEIIVSDGTSTGKKAISLSSLVYSSLKDLFKAGIDNLLVSPAVGNKNYAFTVTGATFGSASSLQSDANVATYAITGATYNDLTNPSTALADKLGMSKLKTITSVSISDPTQRTAILKLLNALGNPVDRAKLKLTA